MRVQHLLIPLLVASPALAADKEKGIPVLSELVRTACGACHEADSENLMSRISYMRKSPEGWQLTVKRMIRMGRVSVTPAEARDVVRYLSDHHPLTPVEARETFYEAEKRPTIEKSPNKDFKDTCIRCHQGSRALAVRRTAEEWLLLKGFHLGYFPDAEFQSFEEDTFDDEEEPPEGVETEGASRPPRPANELPKVEGESRVERVLKFMGKRYPLETPEWRAFQAKGVARDVASRWLFVSHQPTKGLISGEMRIEKAGADYETHATLALADGSKEERSGKAVLYAGFNWRGSSKGAGLGELKEVMMLSDDGAKLTGRFYKGVFGELGLEVTMTRLAADPIVSGVLPRGLPRSAGEARVRILGANFPTDLAPSGVNLGPGITVRSVTATRNAIEAQVSVDPKAIAGRRDVVVGSALGAGVFAVYDRIDYVKVNPGEGMARLGGTHFPKQLAQFEAVAFHRGPDDQPLTADDIDLGPVDARWSIEEFHIRHEDDDVKYVGVIDANGFFTPNVEGPNPERKGTNNFGDVWVVGSFTPPGGKELKGRAHLLVTVPLYALWDQPETIP